MKPKIKEVLVVEGRYDKNTLSQVVEAIIVETGGYRIFSDKEKVELLRRLGRERGLILLTDSDGAGFLIRSHLKSHLGPEIAVKNAYIPEIVGKERRKAAPSKAGTLGVEGMKPEILLRALQQAGATFLNGEEAETKEKSWPITKADFMALGLTGRPGAAQARQALLAALHLPQQMTTGALLEFVNAMYSYENFLDLCKSSIQTEPSTAMISTAPGWEDSSRA